jgi:hypothetical protein
MLCLIYRPLQAQAEKELSNPAEMDVAEEKKDE